MPTKKRPAQPEALHAKARALLAVPPPEPQVAQTEPATAAEPVRRCPCCGGTMHIIETFERGETPRHQTAPSRLLRIDTS